MSLAAGLPTGTTTSVIDCRSATEAQCRDNELGYMFYHNLGGVFPDNLTGNQTADGVDLTNIQTRYWSGTEYDSGAAWVLNYNLGSQVRYTKGSGLYGWAVRDGDVAAVPEPPMVWLLATGLMGLLGIKGRQRRS